jgi:hypothetical protein
MEKNNLSTLKQKFLEIFEELTINQKIYPLIDFMQLDEQAAEEFISLVKKEGLAKEMFLNTVELYLSEEDLNSYMQLHMDADNLRKEYEDKLDSVNEKLLSYISRHESDMEEKACKISNGFFEEHGKEITRMMQESDQRNLEHKAD